MRKKLYLAVIITIIVIIFNINYTQAYTCSISSRLETIQNISNKDLEKYLKSTYGSSNDTVTINSSPTSLISLNTTLKCLSKTQSSYTLKVGKRKKYNNTITKSNKFIQWRTKKW